LATALVNATLEVQAGGTADAAPAVKESGTVISAAIAAACSRFMFAPAPDRPTRDAGSHTDLQSLALLREQHNRMQVVDVGRSGYGRNVADRSTRALPTLSVTDAPDPGDVALISDALEEFNAQRPAPTV